jgi:hypothetical protein
MGSGTISSAWVSLAPTTLAAGTSQDQPRATAWWQVTAQSARTCHRSLLIPTSTVRPAVTDAARAATASTGPRPVTRACAVPRRPSACLSLACLSLACLSPERHRLGLSPERYDLG